MPDDPTVVVFDVAEFINHVFAYSERHDLDHSDLWQQITAIAEMPGNIKRIDDVYIGLRCAELSSPNGGIEHYVFVEDSNTRPIAFFSLGILSGSFDEIRSQLMSDSDLVRQLNEAIGRLFVRRRSMRGRGDRW